MYPLIRPGPWAHVCLWVAAVQCLGHTRVAPDPAPGGDADYTEACFIQETVTRLDPSPQILAPQVPVLDTSVITEVRGPVRILGVLFAGYTLYCLWHETQSRKEKDEDSPDQPCSLLAMPAVPEASSLLVGLPAAGPQPRAAPETGRDPVQYCHVIRFMTTLVMVGRHLADALDITDPLGQELHSWGNAFVIPAFSFASGVFNVCADSREVFKIWSCASLACLLSLTLHVLAALTLSSWQQVSAGTVFLHRIRYYWYMPCLFLWRKTILPLMSEARIWQVPAIITFTLVFGVCYVGRHFWMPMDEGPTTLIFIWNRLFAFGPFFAAGALLPRQGCLHLIGNYHLQVLGTLYFSVWHLLLLALPDFRHWNVTACFEPGTCEFHSMGGHFPMAALYRPYSFNGVLMDISIYAEMLPVTLAVIWLVSGVVHLAAQRLPHVLRFCTSCGSHTLFALVLHVPLIEVATLTNVRLLVEDVPEWLRTSLLVLLTFHIVAVLTCDATAGLLHLLATPLLSAVSSTHAESRNSDAEGDCK